MEITNRSEAEELVNLSYFKQLKVWWSKFYLKENSKLRRKMEFI